MKRIRCVNCSNGIDVDETLKVLGCPSCGKKYKNPFYVEPLIEVELEEVEEENSIETILSEPTSSNIQIAPTKFQNDNQSAPNVSVGEFVNVICDSCGSNDIAFISNGYGVCNCCGSKIVLNKHEEPKQEIHIHSGVNVESNASFFGIKKGSNPEELYRDILIDLARSEDTPPDIFDAKFDAAVESNKHLGEFTCNVNGSYSCEIGYDMVRETQYRDSNGHLRTKRENYIEWQPFSGSYAGNQTAHTSLDEKDDLDRGIEVAYLRSLLYDKIDDYEEGTDDIVQPTQNSINEAKERCKDYAKEDAKKSLPGNHEKNFVFNGFANLVHVKCHTIPAYTIKYNYQGAECASSCFATEKHKASFYGKSPDISDEIKGDVDKFSRPLGITALVFLCLSIVLSLLFAIIRLSVTREVGLGVTIPVFLLALILTVIYWIIRKVKQKSIIDANRQSKVEGIKKVLQEKHLSPMTEAEKAFILGGKHNDK